MIELTLPTHNQRYPRALLGGSGRRDIPGCEDYQHHEGYRGHVGYED
jgi:hypothetical protein